MNCLSLLQHVSTFLQELVNSGVVDPASVLKPTCTPLSSNFTSHTPHPVEDTGRPADSAQISSLQEETGTQQTPKTGRAAAGGPLSRKSSGLERYPETMEALRNIGKLKDKFNQLEARVAALEEGKMDQSQLTHLRELINKGNFTSLDRPRLCPFTRLQSDLKVLKTFFSVSFSP